MSAGYIYILCEREFITTGQNVYKIGMTGNVTQRMSKYPKDSELFYTQKTDNVKCVERYLINKFTEDFVPRKDIGSEYFQGKLKAMIATIYNYIMSNMPDDDTPTALQKAKLVDNSDIVMKYIEEFRGEFSCATVKNDDAYAAFLKWAKEKNYFHNVTNATFAKELKSLFGVKKTVENNDTGVYFSLVFPNLMLYVHEKIDNKEIVGNFIKEYIIPDEKGYFNVERADILYRKSIYYIGGSIISNLLEILGVKVVKKQIGQRMIFAVEGYSLKDVSHFFP